MANIKYAYKKGENGLESSQLNSHDLSFLWSLYISSFPQKGTLELPFQSE